MAALRLVASDIDGTLLRSDGTLSPRTAEALARVPVPVVLATGRPVRWLRQLYDQLAEPLPAVCANGAVVYDPDTDEILRAAPMAAEVLADVVARLRAEIPDVALAVEVEDSRHFRYESAWPMHWETEHHAVRVLAGPDEVASLPAVKLLARSAGVPAADFAGLVSRTLGDTVETTYSSSSGLVEISAAGVTKAAGLAWLCEREGFTAADVLAFGDMPNDLPMLAWAGCGVAMGNAHPAVRAVADEVTATNDEDGVAAYLERVF